MIEGRVNELLEPVVEIGLKRGDTVTNIPVIVDTGFSGDLCLAEQYIDQIEMTFKFVERYELANGEVITQDVFRGSIVFDGREQEVEIIVMASQDTLIGASLLKDYELHINYPKCTVQIKWATEVPDTTKLSEGRERR
jgi:clan AA aspartic protease